MDTYLFYTLSFIIHVIVVNLGLPANSWRDQPLHNNVAVMQDNNFSKPLLLDAASKE